MLKLSAPWVVYCQKIEALFRADPDIQIKVDAENTHITLYVDNPLKAEAISKILPEKVSFGDVTLVISIIPANLHDDTTSIINAAFKGNKAVGRILHIETPITGAKDYVMFKPEVVQFFVDDLGDPHGNESTLYQDIARDILNIDNVLFCTEQQCLF